jgi:hypothetical protein
MHRFSTSLVKTRDAVVRHPFLAGGIAAFGGLVASAGNALATPTFTTSPVVTGVISEVTGNLAPVLIFAGALIGLFLIFRIIRRLFK